MLIDYIFSCIVVNKKKKKAALTGNCIIIICCPLLPKWTELWELQGFVSLVMGISVLGREYARRRFIYKKRMETQLVWGWNAESTALAVIIPEGASALYDDHAPHAAEITLTRRNSFNWIFPLVGFFCCSWTTFLALVDFTATPTVITIVAA